MNLTVIPNESVTSSKVVGRARKLPLVARGSERWNCDGAFWKNEDSETHASGKMLALKLLGTLVVGGTLAVLGVGQIGAMFWLFELAAFVFAGFIPGLLLL